MPDEIYQEALDKFTRLFEQAHDLDLKEPAAVALATADAQGRPSVRMVLLRGFDPGGFVFYTNSRSRKGQSLAVNRHAAMCFYWQQLAEQIRIEGTVEEVTEQENDAYWESRPRGSQIAAFASDQSDTLEDRGVLDARFRELEAEFEGVPVPRPAHWHGYRIQPDRIEFWTGRPARMHERTLYCRSNDGWTRCLLYP